MNIQSGRETNYCTQNAQDIDGFKCNVCALTFRISSERNMHVLDHFQRENCSICSETLIRLGSIWYSIREHPEHNVIKYDMDSNGDTSEQALDAIFEDAVKSEPDAIHDEPTESQFEECFTGSSTAVVNDDVNCQTEFVRVPDFLEQKPFNATEEPKPSTPVNFEVNEDDNEKLKIKTKGQCHICMKKIVCASALKSHIRLHYGIKPFKCELCEKATFTDKRNLNVHKKKCKGKSEPKKNETPLVCEFCDVSKTYANKRNLNVHKEKHFPTNANLQVEDANLLVLETIKLTTEQIECSTCPICREQLPKGVGLKNHMLTHQTPTYQCKLCTTTYKTIDKYRAHKAIHYTIKDFHEEVKMVERESENTDWVCEYCNTDFKLEINLAKHIQKEHNNQKLEHSCNICIEKFSGLSDLLAHMRAHPESTQYKCTFEGCEHGFAFKAKLSTHLEKHKIINGHVVRKTQDNVRAVTMQEAANRMDGARGMDKRPPGEDTTCNVCSKKFAYRSTMLHHVQATHKNERIKCLGCDRIFKGKTSAMTKHIELNHPELIRACQTCKKVFYSDATLAEHQLKHNSTESGLFACSLCPKTFAYRNHLFVHLNAHEKEVKCDVCNEKFSSVKTMLAHRERHGKEQTINCRFPGCNETFTTRREFVQHGSQHPENEKAKTICPQCGKSISKEHFKDHMNIHTGATPYECATCQKRFAKSSSLRRHKMIHTGEKPYLCDVGGCKQAYRDSIDLKRHKFSVHKIYTKKHICSICSKVFSERKLLRNHIVKVHDKVDLESVTNIN